jgi:uncharacterized protein
VVKAPPEPPRAAPAPAPQVAQTGPRAQPSFDCANARSTTEKLICADEDLARQDRELGRIHARAKQAAPDPRAFQRQSDVEWAQREATCRDEDCLRRWYAQRRQDLSAAATARPAPAPAPAPRVERAERPDPAPRAERAARIEAPEPVERPPVARAPAERPPVASAPVVESGPWTSRTAGPPSAAGGIPTATGDVGDPD